MSSSKEQIPAKEYEILDTLFNIRHEWLASPRGVDWLTRTMDSSASKSIIYRLLEVTESYPPTNKFQMEQTLDATNFAFFALKKEIKSDAMRWALLNLKETCENRRDPAWIPPWERDEMQEVQVTEDTQ